MWAVLALLVVLSGSNAQVWPSACQEAIYCRLIEADVFDRSYTEVEAIYHQYFDINSTAWNEILETHKTMNKSDVKTQDYNRIRDAFDKMNLTLKARNPAELQKELLLYPTDLPGYNDRRDEGCRNMLPACTSALQPYVNARNDGCDWSSIPANEDFACGKLRTWPPGVTAGLGSNYSDCYGIRGRCYNLAILPAHPDSALCNATRTNALPKKFESPFFGELLCGHLQAGPPHKVKPRFLKDEKEYKIVRDHAPKDNRYFTSIYALYDNAGPFGRYVSGLGVGRHHPREGYKQYNGCNGPLTAVSLITKKDHLTDIGALCAGNNKWINVNASEKNQVHCPPRHVICGIKFYFNDEDFNVGGFLGVFGKTVPKATIRDIQLTCCSLDYNCEPDAVYTEEVQALSFPNEAERTFKLDDYEEGVTINTGFVDVTSQFTGGSKSSSNSFGVTGEVSAGMEGIVSAKLEGHFMYTSEDGEMWKNMFAQTKEKREKWSGTLRAKAGYLTRYFTAVGACGIGRVISNRDPIDLQFVSPDHCKLEQKWKLITNYKYVSGHKMVQEFTIGVDFTTPHKNRMTSSPNVTLDEILGRLPERITNEKGAESVKVTPYRRVERQPSDLYTYPEKPESIKVTFAEPSVYGVSLPPRGLLLQKVVVCSIDPPDKSHHNITFHTDDLDAIAIPNVNCEPREEYRKIGEQEALFGEISIKYILGVQWRDLLQYHTNLTNPPFPHIPFVETELLAKFRGLKNSKYNWEAHRSWVPVTEASQTQNVTSRLEGPIRIHQVVGICGDFEVFSAQIEVEWVNERGDCVEGGSGPYKDCFGKLGGKPVEDDNAMKLLIPEVGECQPRDYYKRIRVAGRTAIVADSEGRQKIVFHYQEGVSWTGKKLMNEDYKEEYRQRPISGELLGRLRKIGKSPDTGYDWAGVTERFEMLGELTGEGFLQIEKSPKGKNLKVSVYQLVGECGNFTLSMLQVAERHLIDNKCTNGTEHLSDCSAKVVN